MSVTKPIALDETLQRVADAMEDLADKTTGLEGTTYTPAVSAQGVISWTNNGGKENPSPVDIAGAVESVFEETVTGTTVTITGAANHRYLCGEVATISFTPSAAGVCEVIFTSGSTPAVLTLPATVMMPAWFDAENLEADTVYDISVAGGVYGAVMSWPVPAGVTE